MKRVCMVIIIITVVFTGSYGTYADTSDPFDYARAVYEYILENYFGEIDENMLAENLIRAIAESLDRYSVFLTVEEAGEFFKNMSGEYEGIGITYHLTAEGHRIVSVMRGSPAEKAGILPGDIIYSVNGSNVRMLNSEELGMLIKGPEGEPVTVHIYRKSQETLIEFTMIREKIKISTVSFRLIDKNTGYIGISAFNNETYNETKIAAEYFRKRGVRNIVLDLRDNGGGLVGQAVMVAGLFIPEGVVTKLVFENPGYPVMTYVSDLKEQIFDISVLVNENTASAAELLAAAIQERGAGRLVGTVTFGKGIFQTGQYIASYEAYQKYFAVVGIEITMEETGGYLHMTSGRYLTPLGNDINGSGIIPDVVIINAGYETDIKSIDRMTDGFGYHAGSDEVIRMNAEAVLGLLGYYTGKTGATPADEFTVALSEFQRDNGIGETGTLNYITRRMLDYHLGILSMERDAQLKEALSLLD